MDEKIERRGICNTILIREIADKETAILLQNAFPTLEKYIDHIHTVDGIPLKIKDELQNEILSNFKKLMELKKAGINLFFTDNDKIKKIMLDELKSK